jgi:hypothetical protein
MPKAYDALCYPVASSHGLPSIVLHAPTRLPPPRRRDPCLRCDRGERSKVGGEHPDGSRLKALLARTELVETTGSGMQMSMRLFGDGLHGRAEPIQTFRSQACQTTFSARRHPPLSRLKTPSQRVGPRRWLPWPKDWISLRPSASLAFVTPPSRAGSCVQEPMPKRCMSARISPSADPAPPMRRAAHPAGLCCTNPSRITRDELPLLVEFRLPLRTDWR